MESIGIRTLRNHGAEVIARVTRGERLLVTRDGVEVAELAPVSRRSLSTSELIERRRHLPTVDPVELRRDLDDAIDPSL